MCYCYQSVWTTQGWHLCVTVTSLYGPLRVGTYVLLLPVCVDHSGVAPMLLLPVCVDHSGVALVLLLPVCVDHSGMAPMCYCYQSVWTTQGWHLCVTVISLCGPLRGGTYVTVTSLCGPLRGGTCVTVTSLCGPLRVGTYVLLLPVCVDHSGVAPMCYCYQSVWTTQGWHLCYCYQSVWTTQGWHLCVTVTSLCGPLRGGTYVLLLPVCVDHSGLAPMQTVCCTHWNVIMTQLAFFVNMSMQQVDGN